MRMPVKRTAYTADEKRALRAHHAANKKLSQSGLCAWFAAKFGKPIRQPTVSEVLSSQYSYLDEELSQPARKRFKQPAHPDLERMLADWHFRAQKDVTITGDVLREKAHQFWTRLPQYRNLKQPSWSDGWLDNFKKRHQIKGIRLHGEAASVDKHGMAAELVSRETEAKVEVEVIKVVRAVRSSFNQLGYR